MEESDCTLERGAGAPVIDQPAVSASIPPPLPAGNASHIPAAGPQVEYWKLDGRRIGFGEWWRVAPGVGSVFGCISKILGINLLDASRVQRIEDASVFQVAEDEVRGGVQAKLGAAIADFEALGFHSPVYTQTVNPFNGYELFTVTMIHPAEYVIARILLILPLPGHKVKEELTPFLLSAFEDGRFLFSTRDREKFRSAPCILTVRERGVSLARLWARHQQEWERLAVSANPVLVRTSDESWSVVNDYEIVTFEFGRERRMFVPLTEAEGATDSSILETRSALQASGSRFADAMTQLRSLQRKKNGGAWGAMILLLVTLGISAGAGAWHWSWKTCALILAVLFFHELGHYVAMRAFGYRDVRMFFIPLLGAAVTGKKHNVEGWKKAIVSLMGPVPGIFVGAVLGGIGIFRDNDALTMTAFAMVLLNGINLLPFLPLDGGWFWNTILFCRNRWLEAMFKVLAGLAGIAAAYADLGKIWLYLGIVMLVSVPMTLLVGKAAARIRAAGWEPVASEDDTVPVPVAERIFAEIDSINPGKLAGRALAGTGLRVFEKLNARPPGWLASGGLAAIYFASLVTSVLTALAIAFYAFGPGLLADLNTATEEEVEVPPAVEVAYTFNPSDQEISPATDATADSPSRQIIGIALSREAAVAAMAKLRAKQLPTEEISRIGETLLVTTSELDSAHASALAQMLRESGATVLDEGEPDSLACADLRATAPSADVAEEIREELQLWASIPSSERPLPPWQITDSARLGAYREACAAYQEVVWARESASRRASIRKMQRKSEFRATFQLPGYEQAGKAYRTELHRAELRAIAKLLPADNEAASAVIKHALRQSAADEDDGMTRKTEWSLEMQRLLSRVEPGEKASSDVELEAVEGEDRSIEIRALVAPHLSQTLPAVVKYLSERGCSNIQYGFRNGSDAGEGDLSVREVAEK